MSVKSFLGKALIAGVAASALANASAYELTINPQNTNNANAYQVGTHGAFVTDGATTTLNSVLQIGAADGLGVSSFTETGTVNITNFTRQAAIDVSLNPEGIVSSGLYHPLFAPTGYTVFATIDFSGQGQWVSCPSGTLCTQPGNAFVATSGSYILDLYAKANGSATSLYLGEATLVSSVTPPVAVTLGSGSGQAYTSLNGVFNFSPAPGVTGADGFFQLPDPFDIAISTGNFGGNIFNTTYVGTPGAGVEIYTPGVDENGKSLGPVTGNINFVRATVPEPGTLAIVGLALAILGFGANRRRA